MERKIGEVFQFEFTKLKVEKSQNKNECDGCIFDAYGAQCFRKETYDIIGECGSDLREDKTDVIFVKEE